MAQALATQDNRPLTPSAVVAGMKPELAKTLPKHIDPDAFARTVQTALQLQPDLLHTTPRSLFLSCMKAATDGLTIDGREAALVIRNVKVATKGKNGADKDRWEKHAVYQPMVQGLMKLARNSGEIASIISHVVYENDNFSYVLGDEERIEHAPASFDKEQGQPIAVYAIVKLKDGTAIREVMRRTAVMNIAAQGQNAYQYNPESGKNFAEWWRKTAIRRITKYIPRSSDAIGRFAAAAEAIDGDFDFDGEVQPETPPTPAKKRGAAAAALKDITPAPKQEEPELPPHNEDGEIMDYDGPEQGPGDDI